MLSLKLTQVGNSTGLVLPKEALDRMKVGKGDTVHLVETPDGYALSPYDAEFERQMSVMRGVMKDYRNTLRELAR